MARHGNSLVFAACTFAATASGPVPARDEPRSVAAWIGDAIESCVDSTTLRLGREERHAILDAEDTASVGEALLRRYPAFAQSGLAPQAIVLWRKPASDWLYVTLLINPAKPGEVCFTASFVAGRIGLTPVLLKKYFGVVP